MRGAFRKRALSPPGDTSYEEAADEHLGQILIWPKPETREEGATLGGGRSFFFGAPLPRRSGLEILLLRAI